MTHSLRQTQPANNGATAEASASPASRSLILAFVAGSLTAGLGILFLYLGTIKLLGRDEAARLAAMGVDRYVRDTVGGLELTVAVLLLARTSGLLLHLLVAGVSVVEVGLLHRAPLAAVACLAAHGLSTWARSAHDRGRMGRPGARVSRKGSRARLGPRPRAERASAGETADGGFANRGVV
jgi:hypothetical protein